MYLNVDKLPVQQIKSKYKRNRHNISGFKFMLMNYFHEADLHSYLLGSVDFVTIEIQRCYHLP